MTVVVTLVVPAPMTTVDGRLITSPRFVDSEMGVS